MIFGFLRKNLETEAVAVAFIMSWREDGAEDGTGDAIGRLTRFRSQLCFSFGMRRDVLFEVCEAVLCKPGRVLMLAELCLEPECRRGHGALNDLISWASGP
jgi:hypothetical protein